MGELDIAILFTCGGGDRRKRKECCVGEGLTNLEEGKRRRRQGDDGVQAECARNAEVLVDDMNAGREGERERD